MPVAATSGFLFPAPSRLGSSRRPYGLRVLDIPGHGITEYVAFGDYPQLVTQRDSLEFPCVAA